ncbi:MAG: aldo/keto reductase [Phycisphaeraceae bacterium]|nr:aldo/keto reductase [Phycisphaeraceae bacterium]
MNYTSLGRTGLQVSPICLGTMNFGWHTNESDSFAIMDAALDAGINFFDTANVYGAWSSHAGSCEELIGRYLAQGGRRDRIVLATKVYNQMKGTGGAEINNDVRCLSAMKIMRHCEDSLRRLQTDVIDLYQMHHVDRNCPWEEVWQAMETLIRQGKIIYVGSSNFAAWDIALANQAGISRNLVGLVSEQSVYNLRTRTIELEVIPACRELGLGLIPWSPVGGGYLAGALEKYDQGRRSGPNFDAAVAKMRPQLEAYESLCKDIGHAPAQVALAWLHHNPVVTAPIIGPRTMEQLTTSIQTLDIQLSDETLTKLDEIWPGPGGEAPTAYAW